MFLVSRCIPETNLDFTRDYWCNSRPPDSHVGVGICQIYTQITQKYERKTIYVIKKNKNKLTNFTSYIVFMYSLYLYMNSLQI